jgi:outer membrane protein OmpA-like peptidoglycan-associated protein
MKKVILLAAVALGAMSAQAQQAVEAPKFFDNWSISLVGGGTTPLLQIDEIGKVRGIAGIEIEKQVSPILAVGIEGNWGINTSYGEGVNVFDDQYAGVYGAINLNKLFGACKCKSQLFEVEAVAGAGWGRYYDKNWDDENWYTGYAADHNFFATKAGLNLNFNVSKIITLSLKPSVTWNMSDAVQGNLRYINGSSASASYDAEYAKFNLMAGVTFHLGNKGFKCVKPYDQAEVDALNAQINDLRAANDACNGKVSALAAENAALAAELAACKNRKPEVKEVKIDNYERHVYFNQGSSKIQASQKAVVSMVADYLNNNPGSKVEIKGYASVEGSQALNEKLAAARAEAVKNMLVKTYKIDADRISASGQGETDMFKETSWNRVSICTVK